MKNCVKKIVLGSFVILVSANISVYADCPNPQTQCPAFGSQLADAIGCGWKIKYLAPDDPLTQLVINGTPIPIGPSFKDGLSYCMYTNTSMGPSPAPLTYKLYNKSSEN